MWTEIEVGERWVEIEAEFEEEEVVVVEDLMNVGWRPPCLCLMMIPLRERHSTWVSCSAEELRHEEMFKRLVSLEHIVARKGGREEGKMDERRGRSSS